jgi:hypothetical protein
MEISFQNLNKKKNYVNLSNITYPACAAILANSNAGNGEHFGGLRQTVFPAARAGATIWANVTRGDEPDITPATTPTGSQSLNSEENDSCAQPA